jgi:hypothetical protein
MKLRRIQKTTSRKTKNKTLRKDSKISMRMVKKTKLELTH